MQKLRVTNGVYWVEIPEADLYILCGCPADAVKHLMKMGLIAESVKNGVTVQTGPNAILLSDTTIQKDSFSNLAEFPVLQMLYLQGMILPGHPNNTGRKPMLIGLEDQVRTQSSYIYRGTYGLSTLEELLDAGVPRDLAQDMLRIKLWFAFDNIRRTEDLLELKVVDAPAVELRGGAFVRRRGFNRYEFLYNGDSVTVDLNLGDTEVYLPTYQLGNLDLKREYFSVTHTGEGDGWDVTRPCMASILCFQGRLYLIDAGPNIDHSLTALGIGIDEISGIFHTHGHDDHFAGLTSLVRTDHRIPYYASASVRESVVRKYSALTGRNEATFYQYFEPHDLEMEAWNDVEGLEVMPVLSPHPVETTVLFFRAPWKKGYRSYVHLADISSFDVLRRMVADYPKNGISAAFYESFTKKILTTVDVKKIDIGGGLIHGRAEDFAADASKKLYLSHTSAELTDFQKNIGSRASFGQQDVLIERQGDTLLENGLAALRRYFPSAAEEDLAMLGTCPRERIAADATMQRAEAPTADVYFILGGMVEVIDPRTGLRNRSAAGSFIGDLDCLDNGPARRTSRAVSTVTALRIPTETFMEFLRRAGVMKDLRGACEHRQVLQASGLFGETVSLPLQLRIAGAMERRQLKEDDVLAPNGKAEILLLDEGLLSIFLGARPIENLKPGGFFGEETMMRGARELPPGWRARFARPSGSPHFFEARALMPSTLYAIPAEAIEDIPVVQWKLMETYERRLKGFRAEVHFTWDDSYVTGIPEIDDQHRQLFTMIEGLAAAAEGPSGGDRMSAMTGKLVSLARSHLRYEEALGVRQSGNGYEEAIEEHGEFLRKIDGFSRYLHKAPVDALQTTVELLKDWVIDHTLIEHRRYGKYLLS